MKARPGELKLKWKPGSFFGPGKGDMEAAWGGEGACKADANFMLGYMLLEKSVFIKTLAEIERRGYDLNTLKISIRKKK